MNPSRLLPLAAFALIVAGCSTESMDTTADVLTRPVTHPINAAVNDTLPLPQESQYTYWRRQPGTNLFEPYTSDHPLSPEEQAALGIVPPAAKPAPVAP